MGRIVGDSWPLWMLLVGMLKAYSWEKKLRKSESQKREFLEGQWVERDARVGRRRQFWESLAVVLSQGSPRGVGGVVPRACCPAWAS